MKKFNFELQEILEIRKFEQQQAEAELAKALAAEKEIQDKLDALALQLIQNKKSVKGSTDFYAITNATQFSQFVKRQSEFLLEKLSEAKLVSDQKREVLKGCMQKTDALENLKSTQFSEYKKLAQKEEDESTDEIVTSRFGRKS